MKRLFAKIAVFATVCGGAVVAAASAATAWTRLALNHCEPVLADD